MEEVWKDIPGFEGLYQVSNTGKVKSLRKSIIMRPSITRGYEYINLRYSNGEDKSTPVHRLVALAFIPNPHNYKCVNHKDENKLNNNVDNLEWCTLAYNFNYGTCRVRQGLTYGKPVDQLRVDGFRIASYCSAEYAAKINNVDPSSIHKCCKGKRESVGGYLWRYSS